MLLKPLALKAPFVANLATPVGRTADLFRTHWGRAPDSLLTQVDALTTAMNHQFGVASTPTPWGGWKFDAMTRTAILPQIDGAVRRLAAIDPNNSAHWPSELGRHLDNLYTGDAPRPNYSAQDARALDQADRANLLHALLVEGNFDVRVAVEKVIAGQTPAFKPNDISDAIAAHRFATKTLFGTAPSTARRTSGRPTDNELFADRDLNVSVLPTKTGALGFFFALPSHPGFSPAKAAELLLSGTTLKQRGGIERVGGQADGHLPPAQPEPIGQQDRVSYHYAFEAVPKS